jgi:hypothetical protein
MKGITKASRMNSALQVIQYMNNGITVVDACQQAGLPRSSFNDIIKSNPEALTEIQNIIETTQREQLGMALMANTQILGNLIDDGLAEETKPRDRLTIYLKLRGLINELSQSSSAESEFERHTSEFLIQWSKRDYVESRLTVTMPNDKQVYGEKPDKGGHNL